MKPLYELQKVHLPRAEAFCLTVDELVLYRGGLYALHGANGAGKSTLLSLLALLLAPRLGQMAFQGEPVRWTWGNLSRLRRQVTMVEQNPYLLTGSVFNNIDYGLRRRHIDKDERDQRIHSALDKVGLAGYEHRDTRELSQGEIQRVALARAVAIETQVLLLDEPTANSDQQHQEIFLEQIACLHQQGISVVFATHNMAQARQLDAEIVVLEQGRVLGPPRKPLRSVQNARQRS